MVPSLCRRQWCRISAAVPTAAVSLPERRLSGCRARLRRKLQAFAEALIKTVSSGGRVFTRMLY